jgi:hypothetical protein
MPDSDVSGFESMNVRLEDADGLMVIAEWLMVVE